MNYYIQGDPARADKIKAAFEAKGCVMHTGIQCDLSDMIYFSLNGKVGGIKLRNLDLFKTHPDYKELELPVEPKFKVGDWIAYNENKSSIKPKRIMAVTENKYIIGVHESYDCKTLEADWHLWTIQDAKDGDVLANDAGCIFINAGFEKDDKVTLDCYCYVSVQGDFYEEDHKTGSWLYASHIHPATKEQRDLLFKKMKEAGYTWDEKKKELRKIQPHYDISNFQPFDKVLVRCSNDEEWMIEFYCKYDTLVHTSPHRDYPFMGIGDSYSQCIPFDGNEALLGTTDMCDKCYINW